MYKQLPHGIKMKISRSIMESFKQYMSDIEWNVEKCKIEDYTEYWQRYVVNHSKWLDELEEDVRQNPLFHEELAIRITEKVNQLLNEDPTEKQLESLQELDASLLCTCKLEAE